MQWGFQVQDYSWGITLACSRRYRKPIFLVKKRNNLAGLSSGALIASLHCLNSDIGEAKASLFDMFEMCAAQVPYHCVGTFDSVVSATINKTLS